MKVLPFFVIVLVSPFFRSDGRTVIELSDAAVRSRTAVRAMANRFIAEILLF
jgi:hypothetical protein